MASSFPQISLDMNLAQPTQTSGQRAAPVWMPYFASSRGPVTVNDSLLLDKEVSIGVARSLVTPRDQRVLCTRDDNQLISDVVAQSVQNTAYIASVGHRFLAKSHEVQVLRDQLAAERNLVVECQRDVKKLKLDRARIIEDYRSQFHILQEENRQLSKMVYYYSKEMQGKLEALENPGKRKRDHERSSRGKGAIVGGSGDEPQEATLANLREEIQRTKLKAPNMELESAP